MLTDEQITKITNHFVRMGKEIGFENGIGMNICLFKHEDGYSLEIIPPRDPRLKSAETKFNFPCNLPGDEFDAAIELAGLISYRLHGFSRNKKANSSRSDAAKKAAAHKASSARWGQEAIQS